MKKNIRRRVISILISILLFIFSIDALLYWIDPLGVVAARHAQASFLLVMQSHETGYRLETGEHWLHNYTMTINPDGNRLVPNTNPDAACNVAAIGDSVTMGIGVDDRYTWVNLLAQDFPNVHFLNTGRSDYSAPNVYQLMEVTPAQGYIWLISDNDVIDAYLPQFLIPLRNPYLPASRLYIRYFQSLRQTPTHAQPLRPVNEDTYWDYAHRILSNDNVIAFALDYEGINDVSRRTAQRYENVILIPPYVNRLSPADGHPSVEGHVEIYNAMRDSVQDFVERICP